MNKKTRYTAEKALEKIWEIESDSELNDSADSDDDDKIAPNPRKGMSMNQLMIFIFKQMKQKNKKTLKQKLVRETSSKKRTKSHIF